MIRVIRVIRVIRGSESLHGIRRAWLPFCGNVPKAPSWLPERPGIFACLLHDPA